MKRTTNLLAVLLSIPILSINVSANTYAMPDNPPDRPNYTYIQSINPIISKSRSTISYGGNVIGNSSVVKISATAILQKYNDGTFIEVDRVSKTVNSRSITLSDNYSPASTGTTYRTRLTAKAYYTTTSYESASRISATA